jgi:pantetheine-phosphate adenylyltransferase
VKTALFPGTFDPPTLGHLDLIKRSGSVCDKLYVGIAINPAKSDNLFNIEERKSMLETICKPYPYAEVVTFSTLAVEFAKQNNVDFLLRGLRAFSDFEYEFRMALTNRHLSGFETVFLMPDEGLGHISSTLIREVGKFKTRLLDFVPPEIEEQIFNRVSK